MKKIVGQSRKTADELVCKTLRLFNRLRYDQTSPIKRAPVFQEASKAKLESFDYYGYSPAGPIVPPIDLSWCSTEDLKFKDFSIPSDISLFDSPSPGFGVKRLPYLDRANGCMEPSKPQQIGGRNPQAGNRSFRVSLKHRKELADNLTIDRSSYAQSRDDCTELPQNNQILGSKPTGVTQCGSIRGFGNCQDNAAVTLLNGRCLGTERGDGCVELSKLDHNGDPRIPEKQHNSPRVSRKQKKKYVDRCSDIKCGDGHIELSKPYQIGIPTPPEQTQYNSRKHNHKNADILVVDRGSNIEHVDRVKELRNVSRNYNTISNQSLPEPKYNLPPVSRKRSKPADVFLCAQDHVLQFGNKTKELSRIARLQSSNMFSKQKKCLPAINKAPDILVCDSPPTSRPAVLESGVWVIEPAITPLQISSNLLSEQNEVLPPIDQPADILVFDSPSPVHQV